MMTLPHLKFELFHHYHHSKLIGTAKTLWTVMNHRHLMMMEGWEEGGYYLLADELLVHFCHIAENPQRRSVRIKC